MQSVKQIWKNRLRTDNKLFFVYQNSNDLLITIGDSWTWGDSLGDLSIKYRSKHLYGRYLSEQFKCDWINYGFCGAGNNKILEALDLILQCILDDYGFNLDRSNYEILAGADWPDYDTFYSSVAQYPEIVSEMENFIIPSVIDVVDCKNLSNLITKKYQNIHIVITLTETGRDSYSKNAKDRFTNVKDFLIDDETHIYQKIKKLNERYKNINLVVARNFSSDFKEVSNSISIKKNWLNINFEENQRRGFDNHGYSIENIQKTGAVSGIAFNSIQKIDYADKKQYIINQIDNCDKLWHWLRNNPLNYNRATCHPTEESHKLWADYLIQYLQ